MKNIIQKTYLVAMIVLLSLQIFVSPLNILANSQNNETITHANDEFVASQGEETENIKDKTDEIQTLEVVQSGTEQSTLKEPGTEKMQLQNVPITAALSVDISFTLINKADENDQILVSSNVSPPVEIDSKEYDIESNFDFSISSAINAGEKFKIFIPEALAIAENISNVTADGNVKFSLIKDTNGNTYLEVEFLKAVSKGDYTFYFRTPNYNLTQRLTDFIYSDESGNELAKYTINFDPLLMKDMTLKSEFAGYIQGLSASATKTIKWNATTTTKRGGNGEVSLSSLEGRDYANATTTKSLIVKRYEVNLDGSSNGLGTVLVEGQDYNLVFDAVTKTDKITFNDNSQYYYYEIQFEYAYDVVGNFDYGTYYSNPSNRNIYNPDYEVSKQNLKSYVNVSYAKNVYKIPTTSKIIDGTTTEVSWEIQYNYNQTTIPVNQILEDVTTATPQGTLSTIKIDSIIKKTVSVSEGYKVNITEIGPGDADWQLNGTNLEYIGPANNTHYYIFQITTRISDVVPKDQSWINNKVAETVKATDDWDPRIVSANVTKIVSNILIEKTGTVKNNEDLYNGIYTWTIDINAKDVLENGIPAQTQISDRLEVNGGSIEKTSLVVSFKPFTGSTKPAAILVEGTDYTITYNNNDHGFDLVFLEDITEGSVSITYQTKQSEAEKDLGYIVSNTVTINIPGEGIGEDSATATIDKNTLMANNNYFLAQVRDTNGEWVPGEVKTYAQINLAHSSDITNYLLNYRFLSGNTGEVWYDYDFTNIKIYEADKLMVKADINSDGSLNTTDGKIKLASNYSLDAKTDAANPQSSSWYHFTNYLTFNNYNGDFGSKSIIIEMPAYVKHVSYDNWGDDYTNLMVMPTITYTGDDGITVEKRFGTAGAQTYTRLNNNILSGPIQANSVITGTSLNAREFTYDIYSYNNKPLQNTEMSIDLSDTANNSIITKVSLTEEIYGTNTLVKDLVENVDYTVNITNTKHVDIELIGEYAILGNQKVRVKVETLTTSKTKTTLTLDSAISTSNAVRNNWVNQYSNELKPEYTTQASAKISQEAIVDLGSDGSDGSGFNTTMQVNKVDQFGTPVSGAEFSLLLLDGTPALDTENNQPIIGVTDIDGKIVWANVLTGQYLIKETNVPLGYNAPTTLTSTGETISVMEVEITPAKNVYTFTNTMLTSPVLIEKTSSVDNNLKLPDAKLEIYLLDNSGNITGSPININGQTEFLTDANGQIHLEALAPGTYGIKELQAPLGYEKDNNLLGTFTVIEKSEQEISVIITNNPTPYPITINKTDESGNPLSGAEFSIQDISGTVLESGLVTDNFGIATSVNTYTPGTYKVVETKAPTGYNLNTTEYSVTVAIGGGTASITVINTATPYPIAINKTDESGNPLSGAEFNILDSNGIVLESGLITDTLGIATSTNTYTPGTYKVVETKAPTGYNLNTTEYPVIVIIGGGTASITVTNTATPYGIEIIKENELGNPLSGAEFNLLDSNGTILETGLTTDATGKVITTNEYTPGTYKVVETKAPTGYDLNMTEHSVTITIGGGTATVTVTNTATPYPIEITKVDENSNPLLGAEFNILDDLGVVLETGLTTNAAGIVTSTKTYAPGTYKVVETKAPAGYVLDSTEHQVVITVGGGTATITIVNGATPYPIEIVKVDAAYTPLSGAEFSILDAFGTVLETGLTTDATGKVVSTKTYAIGNYKVVETKAPVGYDINTVEHQVTVAVNGGMVSVTVINTPTAYNIEIKKVDESGNPLSGAEFSVLDNNGTVLETGLTTDTIGLATSTKTYAPGTYKVVETKAPVGYNLDTSEHSVTITVGGGIVTVTVVNTATPYPIEIKKVNEFGNPLSGAEFSILDNNGIVLEAGLVTNASGTITSTKAYTPGTYKVLETKAPVGYVLDNTEHPVVITVNGGTATITITNGATPYPIEITKVDEFGMVLSGAEFNILDTAGTVLESGLITDTTGTVTSTNTYAPGTYNVVEVIAPTGYVLDTTEYPVTITIGGGTALVTIVNIPTSYPIEIVKVDEIGNPLLGAEFNILDNNGTILETGLTTDATGIITSTNAYAPGTYKVVEIKAPEGYQLDTTEHPVIITINGGTKTVEITNIATPYPIEIIKVDELGNPLPGAGFNVLDNNGIVLESGLITDATGTVTSMNTYAPGTYKIVETKAPAGYQLDITEHLVTITINGGKETIEITNIATPYLIQINKVDESGNSLAGAEFNILDNNGTVLESGLITDATGTVISTNVYAPGTYNVVEVQAPTGYILNMTEYPVTVTVNGGTANITITNIATPYPIEIKKIDELGNPLAGAEFDIMDDQGIILESSLSTDTSGTVISTNAYAPGTYKIVETKAPVGYQLDTREHEIVIKVNGGMETIVITNYMILGEVKLLLTDDDDLNPTTLEGGEFRLEQKTIVTSEEDTTQVYKTDKEIIVTIKDGIITDQNGQHMIDALAPGIYQFVQLSAPKSYSFEQDTYEFEVPFNCQEQILVHVINTRNVEQELPQTGERRDLIILSGITLMLSSLIILYVRKKMTPMAE